MTAYKFVSIFISSLYTFTIPLTFYCQSSGSCSCDLCERCWVHLSRHHVQLSQRSSKYRICGHNNKYMSNILLSLSPSLSVSVSYFQGKTLATLKVFLCTYICLNLTRYCVKFIIKKFQGKRLFIPC